ncbi:Flp pilus assembly protein CpaB [Aporhodopirellula aestuarii]|uniref:Flp pilus assembly protein CpaB n=1 Tax=Aporhodopirellula aestuarii TaxID=2950107 RepID=A0ABT0U7B2_9BACT|nr:Flp pilus assembly protein CpaB [Aporhodopirellula aestuarii]MCM2372802.1 Flp pilus assembly protein CpaB [Aporhodopirellula aestuarii]
MRNKTVPLLIACVCGTIAAIGLSQWMQAQSTGESSVASVEIFVTAKTIDIAEQITADKIRLEQWPADRVPKGASGKLADLEGKYARQRFYEGEPIMPVKLMDDSNGSSQTIPLGFSVVSMRADPESSVATLVRPGDRVDVVAYFTKSELIPETMAKTVLTGVRVFAVDGRTERENNDEEKEAKPARSISLLINKKDTPAWTYASELGKIRLTLGNPTDITDTANGEGSGAGQEFLTWLSDYQAAQAARLEEGKRPAPKPAARTPVSAPVKEKKKGFKMLKMSGGVLTEYWIEEGKQVPVILNESGPDGIKEKDEELDSNPTRQGADRPAAPSDYSYLNGAESPFYQPPSNQDDRNRP